MADTIEIELDERKRAPLAKLLKGRGAKRYAVERRTDGVIVLTPMVSVPADRLGRPRG